MILTKQNGISLLVLVLLISSFSCSSQKDIAPFKYHELMSIDTLEGKIRENSIRKSRIARNYTFLGEYVKSDSLAPIVFPDEFDELECSDFDFLDQFEQVDPFHIIDSLSKLHNIILINENHAFPLHRIFFHNMLDDLKRNGYSLIGLEALCTNYKSISGLDSVKYNLNDTLINSRGYPIYSDYSGTYTKEPQMGNVIRRGVELGYNFFGYEKIKGDRELNQAKNIAKIRKAFPDEKIVVLCGFMHLAEDTVQGIDVKLMGQYLEEELGEEILTIEQTRLSYNPIQNSLLFRYVDPKFSCILQNNKTNEIFNVLPEMNNAYDVSIFHPRFDIYMGRPKWLYEREGAKEYNISFPDEMDYPYIVTAFPAKENDSTPVDIVVVHSNNKPPLFLTKGNYTIKIYDQKDHHEEYTITID